MIKHFYQLSDECLETLNALEAITQGMRDVCGPVVVRSMTLEECAAFDAAIDTLKERHALIVREPSYYVEVAPHIYTRRSHPALGKPYARLVQPETLEPQRKLLDLYQACGGIQAA